MVAMVAGLEAGDMVVSERAQTDGRTETGKFMKRRKM